MSEDHKSSGYVPIPPEVRAAYGAALSVGNLPEADRAKLREILTRARVALERGQTFPSNTPRQWPRNMRRWEASEYLLAEHGISARPGTLAAWFSKSTKGPPAYIAGYVPLYPRDGLDAWAKARLGRLRSHRRDGETP